MLILTKAFQTLFQSSSAISHFHQQPRQVLVSLPTLGNVGLWDYSHSSECQTASHVVGLCFQRIFCCICNYWVTVFSFSTEAVISCPLACIASVRKSAAKLTSVPHMLWSLSLYLRDMNVTSLSGHGSWVCICVCM